MSDLPKIIVLQGPTGVGKTAFSLAAAEALNAEIVSVDSVQMYRGLDIGSAKATVQEQARVRHHLLDTHDPDQPSHVADYMERAHAAIAEIHSREKAVICAGGTNLYTRVLVHGIFHAPPPDEAIRARHREKAQRDGVNSLYQALTLVDPTLAQRLGQNDLVRISRGLEVFEQTGRRLSELQDEHKFATPNYDAFKLVFNRPRPDLYERINLRVDRMMEQGLLGEYHALTARYDRHMKPLMSLGYRHMGLHVFDATPLSDAVELLKRDTRRFAKQQVSWLRSEQNVRWALAPMMTEGTIPAAVLNDLRAFLCGTLTEEPRWVSNDSNHLKDIPT